LHRRLLENRGATRREALQSSLASAACLLSWGRSARASQNGKRVVVVGAGFAGLACAHELLAVGYDVEILEAGERVGGRVYSRTDFVQGRSVEIGGELIGANHPTWVAYAKKFGLHLLELEEESDPPQRLFVDGKAVEGAELTALEDEVEKSLTSLTLSAALVNVDQPWKSPNAGSLDRKTTLAWIEEQKASPNASRFLNLYLAGNNGVRAADQSLLGNLAQIKGGGLAKYWTDSETHRCEGGNARLAQKLAEAIGLARIHRNTPVKSIIQKNGRCIVQSVDGKRWEADDVVLAAPPSIWPSLTLDPPIPLQGRPQMGTCLKWLARVDGRFWNAARLSSNSVSDGDLSATWESSKSQRGPGEAGLVGFSGGPAALNILKRDAQSREAWYRETMEQVYPGFNKHLLESKFVNWSDDPWTKASYSFPAPGQVTTMGPVLYAGVDNLHFAGEHACYKFIGYMEGGLNSGASLARRLAKRDGVA
jgi:monoamine oxidase